MIGALVLAALLYYATKDARTDQELARKGIVSPRLQAKYGPDAAGRTAGYGFFDYLADARSDRRRQRTEARRAAVDAPPSATGAKVRLRDRLAAVKGVLTRVATKVRDHPVTRILIDPVGEPRPDRTTTAVDPPTGTEDPEPSREPVIDTVVLPTPSKEQPVSQPTGEATNLHQAIAEIDAITAQVRIQQDQAAAAKRALDAVDNAIDGMQARQATISNAARSLAEHLTALNVNAAILAPLFDTANVLAASDADQLISAVETARAIIDKILAGCDAALGALTTARQTLVGKFADAASTVETELGGDSRFVGGENATTGGGSRTRVYDEPVDARGATFGSGNTYEGSGPAPSGTSSGPRSTTNSSTFNGPTDARGSSHGNKDVVNNW